MSTYDSDDENEVVNGGIGVEEDIEEIFEPDNEAHEDSGTPYFGDVDDGDVDDSDVDIDFEPSTPSFSSALVT